MKPSLIYKKFYFINKMKDNKVWPFSRQEAVVVDEFCELVAYKAYLKRAMGIPPVFMQMPCNMQRQPSFSA